MTLPPVDARPEAVLVTPDVRPPSQPLGCSVFLVLVVVDLSDIFSVGVGECGVGVVDLCLDVVGGWW